MPTPLVAPLSAVQAPQEARDPSLVQSLGMDVSHTQPLVRNPSVASDASLPSGASTPLEHGDYAATRTYIPSHSYTSSRLHNHSSFSTGTSQSPASSEAHEELASLAARSTTQHDSSTHRYPSATDTLSRASYLTHGNRVLSHKDSFGGSYSLNAATELSSDPAGESSASSFAAHSQRVSNSYPEKQPFETHDRTGSLSTPAQPAHHGLALSARKVNLNTTAVSDASDQTEPVEMLGRPSAFMDLASSQVQRSRSPSLVSSHSRTALSAAANAASDAVVADSTADPAEATFATRFDLGLALDTEQHQTSPASGTLPRDRRRVPAAVDTGLSNGDLHSLGLPQSSIVKSSSGSASTLPTSSAREGNSDDAVTPSATSSDVRQANATSGEPVLKSVTQRKQIVPAAPYAPQQKDRDERDESNKSPASASRKSGTSRARDTVGASNSTRADAASAATRSLKTSHRTLPQLPSAHNVRPAPPPAMYWSKAPVHGSVPRRSFRAHTANLCDEVLWLFGGCDNRGCFRDLWCFDTETMCWSRPKVTGDIPPARRAHSATMVNKRLFVFAGGDGPHYFNDLYIFDTVSLRWTKPEVGGTAPSPRRAHTCNYHEGQLIVFGGGNGVGALNDVHTLDVSDLSRLEWRKMKCSGKVPIGRGYHTSNLVDGKLIVIGGSDGHLSFSDIHILRLDTQTWYQVKTDEIHNRLGHTATQVGSYLFIFGGHDSKTYTSELLTLNLVNLQWEPRKVWGKKPQGRGYHQAWLRDSRLFVHGGFDGKDIFDDLHYLDLAACAYLPQITSFSVELDDEE